jgi:hypothetical protein
MGMDAELMQRAALRYQGFEGRGGNPVRLECWGERVIESGIGSGEVVRRGSRLFIRDNEPLGWLDRQLQMGRIQPHVTMTGLDLLLRAEVALQLLERGGIMLHASSVGLEGRGHVFMGASGAGKSTVSRMLTAAGAAAVSDEITALMPDGERGSWSVTGTPFRLGHPSELPLQALWCLRHGPLGVRELTKTRALKEVVNNLRLNVVGEVEMSASLRVAAELVNTLPTYELSFGLADAVREAMVGTL